MPIFRKKRKSEPSPAPENNVWARPEMMVTFRAEIMPGKTSEERTYKIKAVLPNGRVVLYDYPDEHRRGSFEPVNFRKLAALRDQNS